MQHHIFHALRRRATKLAATPDDAEDLVQETLLAGWLAGRTDAAFLQGVLRKQAAMAWRSAGRRGARERDAVLLGPVAAPDDVYPNEMAPEVAARVASRPRSLRYLAVLALHGLEPVEIRWLLRLAPAAFRQRVAALRAAVLAAPPGLRSGLQSLASCPAVWRSHGMNAPLRRTLKASLVAKPGIATHDPDGHVLVIGNRPHVSTSHGN